MIRWLVACAALAFFLSCCPPCAPKHLVPTVTEDEPWPMLSPAAHYPQDTESQSPRALYRLTVSGQLAGVEHVDSVTSWSTVGGEIRVNRLHLPGPLVFPLHVFSIASIDTIGGAR